MATFNNTGKQQIRLRGRYLIQTTANILWYSHENDKMRMTKLFQLPASTSPKTFIIEADGHLLYNDDVSEFEMEEVSTQYEQFYAKHLS